MPDRFGNSLLEAAFEGVDFPVSEITVDKGFDIIEHTAYLRPGADLEDAGERAIKGTMTIPFLNDIGYGTQFPDNYRALYRAVKDNVIGQFTHPLEGRMQATLHNWRVKIAPDQRSGVIAEVDYIEHNSTATSNNVATLQDSPTSVEASATESDTLMESVLDGSAQLPT